jgi:hypothetical protein
MSYGFSFFHPEVKRLVGQGLELDAFEHPDLNAASVDQFMNRLVQYGYVVEQESPVCREYVKFVGSCPIQVGVFQTEISFSSPYWNGSDDAIFEALQDSAELCDADHMAIFNPQTGEWCP